MPAPCSHGVAIQRASVSGAARWVAGMKMIPLASSRILNADTRASTKRRVFMTTDPLFHMVVEDVFIIAKRGTVVTGKIETGTLKVGDEVVVRGRGREKKAAVGGIESFKKMLQQASQGDTVGILLKDLNKVDVQRGDELVCPDSDFTWNP